jgi:hypothetical protein
MAIKMIVLRYNISICKELKIKEQKSPLGGTAIEAQYGLHSTL